MTEREALRLALEALVLNNAEWKALADSGDSGFWEAEEQDHYKQTGQAIAAIKEALAQPEQEPWSNVGIGVDVTKEGVSVVGIYKLSNDSSHLFYSQFYTTPPQRTWVGLTPQERDEINEQVYGAVPHHVAFHAAIEAKLKEKNI